MGGAFRIIGGENPGLYFRHGDHLGSTSVLSDSSGVKVDGSDVVYAPFGELRSGAQSALTDFGYTGQRRDDSTGGLMYYGARYYLPGIQHFISADTIVPEPINPQAFNRYSYVVNNPVKLIDPSGHDYVNGHYVPDWLCQKYPAACGGNSPPTPPPAYSDPTHPIGDTGGNEPDPDPGETTQGGSKGPGDAGSTINYYLSTHVNNIKAAGWIATHPGKVWEQPGGPRVYVGSVAFLASNALAAVALVHGGAILVEQALLYTYTYVQAQLVTACYANPWCAGTILGAGRAGVEAVQSSGQANAAAQTLNSDGDPTNEVTALLDESLEFAVNKAEDKWSAYTPTLETAEAAGQQWVGPNAIMDRGRVFSMDGDLMWQYRVDVWEWEFHLELFQQAANGDYQLLVNNHILLQ